MESLYQKVYPLWNADNIPFAQADDAEKTEHLKPANGDNIERFTDVTNPTVTFFPAAGKGSHPAVLVCPGGGYEILAWNHEGRDICGWLNNNGFSCFLLKYRSLRLGLGVLALLIVLIVANMFKKDRNVMFQIDAALVLIPLLLRLLRLK